MHVLEQPASVQMLSPTVMSLKAAGLAAHISYWSNTTQSNTTQQTEDHAIVSTHNITGESDSGCVAALLI